MQNCCIPDCDSHKSNSSPNIAYFKFPLHDEDLLQQWLMQMGRPNWRPNENTYICAKHFRARDIDSNPKRKFLLLKPTAKPTIFPKEMLNLQQQQQQLLLVDEQKKKQLKVPIVENVAKTEVTIVPSMIQATPLILSPTLVNISGMNHPLMPITSAPQRFRKILPKLDHNGVMAQNQLPQTIDGVSAVPPKSYIIIIPTFDNTKPLVPQNPPKLPSPSKKKPILRISVSRKHTEPLTDLRRKDVSPKSRNIDSECENDNGNDENSVEEVVIYNHSLKKSVVFSLDPTTGEISVSRRDIRAGSLEKSNVNRETQVKRAEIQTKQEINYTNHESLPKLKDMYEKAQQDCHILRSRLRGLREKHKQEIEELGKLQNQMNTMKDAESLVCTSDDTLHGEKRKLSTNPQLENDKKRVLLNDGKILTISNGQTTCNTSNPELNVCSKSSVEEKSRLTESETTTEDCDVINISNASITLQTSDIEALDLHEKFLDPDFIHD